MRPVVSVRPADRPEKAWAGRCPLRRTAVRGGSGVRLGSAHITPGNTEGDPPCFHGAAAKQRGPETRRPPFSKRDSQPCLCQAAPSEQASPSSLLCQSQERHPLILVRSPTGCLEAKMPKSLPLGFTAEISKQATPAGDAYSPATSWLVQIVPESGGSDVCTADNRGTHV